MNSIIISGNLGQDPIIRSTQSGKKVANFSVAVRRRVAKDANGNVPTDWLNVTVWGNTAEFAEKYLRKGTRVLVEGRLQTDNYEKDGVKHTKTYIVGENVEFAGGKADNSAPAQTGAPAQAAPPQAPAAVADDDIPF